MPYVVIVTMMSNVRDMVQDHSALVRKLAKAAEKGAVAGAQHDHAAAAVAGVIRLSRVLGHFPCPREIARETRYEVQAYKTEFGTYRGLMLTLAQMVHEEKNRPTDEPTPQEATEPPA